MIALDAMLTVLCHLDVSQEGRNKGRRSRGRYTNSKDRIRGEK